MQLRPKGYLCREATNECDLPEICNGRSGQCPLDIFKKNGNQCEVNKGYCFNGVCPTLDSQCRLIWGDGKTISQLTPHDQVIVNSFLSQAACRAIASVSNSLIHKDPLTDTADSIPTTITSAARQSTNRLKTTNRLYKYKTIF